MKIWVIGAGGMLGSSLCLALKRQNLAFEGTSSKEVDITSYESMENFALGKNFSHIINCAAYTKVDEAEKREKEAFDVNSYALYHLAMLSDKLQAKIVHFSSDYIFSGTSREPYKEEEGHVFDIKKGASPLDIQKIRDFSHPQSVYGKSKLLGEAFLLARASSFLIIRTSWLFGFNGKNFVRTMLELFEKKEEVSVVFDQIGRPTFCEDLSYITIELLSECGIFHFANDLILSWYEFAKIIFSIAQEFKQLKCQQILPISTSSFAALAPRPLYSVLSTKKLESSKNIKIPSLRKALENYISVYFLEQEKKRTVISN